MIDYCVEKMNPQHFSKKQLIRNIKDLQESNKKLAKAFDKVCERLDELEAEISCWEQRYDELKEDYERVCKAHRG